MRRCGAIRQSGKPRPILALACVCLVASGCDDLTGLNQPAAPAPQTAPAQTQTPAPAHSAASQRIARHFALRQQDLLTQGNLRTDGGGPDTPYSPDTLAQNFETIVFFDEYDGAFGQRQSGPGRLRRWEQPVRIATEFGASIPVAQRQQDSDAVAAFATRLSRVANHPISRVSANANFHVLFMSHDDKTQLTKRLQELAPTLSPEAQTFLTNMPLTVECSVVAFAGTSSSYSYTKAIAVIRAELPDLLRQSCIHEEIAQGLGPANDSRAARPSIFNDDDEFAYLTSHDELLLKMLYDPRLKAGMTQDEAHGAVRIIARELMGRDL